MNKNWRGYSMQNASAVNRREMRSCWNRVEIWIKTAEGFFLFVCFLRHSAPPFHHQARPGTQSQGWGFARQPQLKSHSKIHARGCGRISRKSFDGDPWEESLAPRHSHFALAHGRAHSFPDSGGGEVLKVIRPSRGFLRVLGLSPHRSFPQPSIS